MSFESAVIMFIGTDGSDRSCLEWIESVYKVANATGRQVDRYLLADIQRVVKRHKQAAK